MGLSFSRPAARLRDHAGAGLYVLGPDGLDLAVFELGHLLGVEELFLRLDDLASDDVVLEMSDPTRAGILLPSTSENENEDTLMLLMPMMINA